MNTTLYCPSGRNTSIFDELIHIEYKSKNSWYNRRVLDPLTSHITEYKSKNSWDNSVFTLNRSRVETSFTRA
ncbi:hypothetical protein OUZ56_033222 [Daphnia magna]|uniref:Uncharacterized protein n=1 Tax=Daphnia magna TaxID=35525 RepID=A0ABR0BAG1_9CRUS|nr:hypothetical protein OUZ56_033222 [Daphnia magna]